MTDAVPYEPSCPACIAGIKTRGILAFRRSLCTEHQATWKSENEKDLKRTERGQSVIGERS